MSPVATDQGVTLSNRTREVFDCHKDRSLTTVLKPEFFNKEHRLWGTVKLHNAGISITNILKQQLQALALQQAV